MAITEVSDTALQSGLTDWPSLVAKLANQTLDACFFDSLSDGADDMVSVTMGACERRGREPGD